MKVTLTSSELLLAAQAGCMRQVENLFRGREDAYGASNGQGWEMHIQGAAGEFAVSKALNLHWPGKGRLRGSDVGPLQVRTAARHSHCLILHEEDDDEVAFVLVTGLAPSFIIQGWIRGWYGKRRQHWRDPAGGRPAFFVPQAVLNPPEELIHAGAA